MQSSSFRFVPFLVLFCLFFFLPSAGAQVSTTFDADLEGWLVTGDNSSAWEEDTGNPGGCLSVNDLVTGERNLVVAPPDYLGDWSLMTALDTLSVDLYFSTSDPDDWPQDYMFRIAGPGGAARALTDPIYFPVSGEWNYYSVSLAEEGWEIEDGSWSEIVAAVFSLQICGEFIRGNETVLIDNVALSSTPIEVYLPCVHDDFNTVGTGDWSFIDTAGVTNPEDDGNGGGFVRVSDASGVNSYGLAPSKFLGDWSLFDGSGLVTIDLRILARSGTNLGAPEFIRITGPGGSAYVSLSVDDLPPNDRIWKTYQFPINDTEWTLDSGTWAGLVADVSECKIDLEFFDSTESVGFDNFGRRQSDCPPIDDPVVVHDPSLDDCGFYSMVDLYSAALNPLDGFLYGLVNASPSSGGGLYSVMGSEAGTQIYSYDDPDHLVFDDDGDAYITVDGAGVVHRLEWGGESSIWIEEFHPGDDDPLGIIFAPDGFVGPNINAGDILVLDWGYSGEDAIYSFSPDVEDSEQLVAPDPGTVDMMDLAPCSADTVLIVDKRNDEAILLLDPDGNLTPLPLSAPIPDMVSIVYDRALRDIYVASGFEEAVYRVSSQSGEVTLVADRFSDLTVCCLEVDVSSRCLWVVDTGYDRVYEFCLEDDVSAADLAPVGLGVGSLSVHPNPFNPGTKLVFSIPRAMLVELLIHDVAGRLVRRLAAEVRQPGIHARTWDGKRESGSPASPGVYFAKVRTEDGTESVKLILSR